VTVSARYHINGDYFKTSYHTNDFI